MNESKQHLEQLKYILENLRTPERLDNHPWAKSLAVREKAAGDPSRADKSPGQQLALTLADLFRQMMPATPPQSGKRLDTRWGRFGILAANYFAPFLFGNIHPRSLREAWRRIDPAILLFVYGLPANQLKPEQAAPYRLVGDELDFPANSTISDWHRSGLQDLADLFASHEQRLSLALGEPSGLNAEEENPPKVQVEAQAGKRSDSAARSPFRRWAKYPILAVLLLALILLGREGLQLYRLAQTVRQDISSLEQLNPTTLDAETLDEAEALLDKTHADVVALRAEATPWLGLTGRLGWVPAYGGDLQHLGDLLELADGLTAAAQQTFQTVYPIWQTIKQPGHDLKASELTGLLLDTRPDLELAQTSLHQAIAARQRIDPAVLSPEMRGRVLRVDPYLSLLDEALSVALSVPNLLGATEEGPKTYLILIQNEDELRPTGGFITAVAKVVVADGKMIGFTAEDSYAVDDLSKPYPVAPWQLRDYMNLPVLFFRDSNWYANFPTTAKWAEYLYVFSTASSVDGLVAIDQHVLVTLLSVTGPLYVREIDTTVTAENVREVMRAQKVPPPEEQDDPEWQRKRFINTISSSILEKLLGGKGVSWEAVARALMGELDQRHIQVQLDDPTLEGMLAARGWDGAMRRGSGDFLMVVDSNVGYSKTNAVVRSNLSYDVDLTDLSAPASRLTVFHQNDARDDGQPCNPPFTGALPPDRWYAINRCYFNYLRVYTPAAAQLQSATPHPVSRADLPTMKEDVAGQVDLLAETIEGIRGFGTLLMVPKGQGLGTDFHFSLPLDILSKDPASGDQVYRLKIQKQAGTVSIPLTLRVHLPAGSKVVSVNLPGFAQEGDNLLFTLNLDTDVFVQIQFRP